MPLVRRPDVAPGYGKRWKLDEDVAIIDGSFRRLNRPASDVLRSAAAAVAAIPANKKYEMFEVTALPLLQQICRHGCLADNATVDTITAIVKAIGAVVYSVSYLLNNPTFCWANHRPLVKEMLQSNGFMSTSCLERLESKLGDRDAVYKMYAKYATGDSLVQLVCAEDDNNLKGIFTRMQSLQHIYPTVIEKFFQLLSSNKVVYDVQGHHLPLSRFQVLLPFLGTVRAEWVLLAFELGDMELLVHLLHLSEFVSLLLLKTRRTLTPKFMFRQLLKEHECCKDPILVKRIGCLLNVFFAEAKDDWDLRCSLGSIGSLLPLVNADNETLFLKLIAAGASVLIKESGDTPLIDAIRKHRSVACVRALLQAGANASVLVGGETASSLAKLRLAELCRQPTSAAVEQQRTSQLEIIALLRPHTRAKTWHIVPAELAHGAGLPKHPDEPIDLTDFVCTFALHDSLLVCYHLQKRRLYVFSVRPGARQMPLLYHPPLPAAVSSVVVCRQADFMAVAVAGVGVKICTLSTGKLLHDMQQPTWTILSMLFSPQGSRFLLHVDQATISDTISCFDTQSWKQLHVTNVQSGGIAWVWCSTLSNRIAACFPSVGLR
eukprot:TRINITY_DN6862_c0_g1_i1.p1 TRINITY_DN6862_c0_g1~~TRINITY_DN6862_c0_g1_i1.p1  ORF type:complete len:604 (-),score=96.27 TRINITY_DN6862_c0_g1_i1:454-2265(-)